MVDKVECIFCHKLLSLDELFKHDCVNGGLVGKKD